MRLRAVTHVSTINQIVESDTREDLSFKTLHYVIVSNLADLELFSHIQSPWFLSYYICVSIIHLVFNSQQKKRSLSKK